MLSSGVLVIAQADVTKHAREIPIVRCIGITSHPSCRASLAARNESRYPMQIILMGKEMQIDLGPVVPDGTGHER